MNVCVLYSPHIHRIMMEKNMKEKPTTKENQAIILIQLYGCLVLISEC